jgi:SAM-dependent methyltransferase
MRTIWADYETDRAHYSGSSLRAKRDGVARLLALTAPACVLDLGCNAGEFSLLALQSDGVRLVLAADFDPGALIRLQERLDAGPVPIQPIVLDIGRPTPAVGWRNREVASVLDRLRGQIDLIMALGLLHHLIVRECIPLPEIGCMLYDLSAPWLLLEWVPPQDPRFKEIAALNIALYEHLTFNDLQQAFQHYFELEMTYEIEGSERKLTLWRRKST